MSIAINQIVPFEGGRVPAAIAQIFGDANTNDIIGNHAGTGFPVISIKGKVFHVRRGDEKTLITKPGEDDPAASIEVVILKVNPNNSKIYYPDGYVEGSDSKPTCFSNDGITPDKGAEEAQSKKCATCAHNQWGSKITDAGKKARACSDSRRIAIATVDTPADPMLVRVPAASLKAFVDFGKQLAARGIRPESVVTKIGFDYSVAHPALTFKPIGIIGDVETLQEIKHVADSDLVKQIAGLGSVAAHAEEEVEPLPVYSPPPTVAAPAVQAQAPAAVTPPPKPTKAPKAAPAPAPVAATPAPAPVAETKVLTAEKSLEDMLDGLDLDD